MHVWFLILSAALEPDPVKWNNILIASFFVGLVVALKSCSILLQREWVKTALHEQCLQPVMIRWCPFGRGWWRYFGQRADALYVGGSSFRVWYMDYNDALHEAWLVCAGRNKVFWVEDYLR